MSKTDHQNSKQPGVFILGGQANAVSVARSLGRKGIDCFVSSGRSSPANFSRFVTAAFPVPGDIEAAVFWRKLLLENPTAPYLGSLIMPCNDDAVEFVAKYRDQLKDAYLLDDADHDLQLAMLDKEKTIELGKSVGCDIPEYWHVQALQDVEKIKDHVNYPAMLKPIHSHLFQPKFEWKKYLMANNADELMRFSANIFSKDLEFMVCEFIPGPDSLLSSYHTYIDENGDALFEYTHQIIRRYPQNAGGVTMNVSKWLPETAQAGKQFFEGINYKGMAHIEFKRDPRDNKLKIIECNPRYSAAQALAQGSGMDMPYLIYRKVLGLDVSPQTEYKQGVTRWIPLQDVLAFRELHKKGELSLTAWMKSFLRFPLVFPYLSISDPSPFVKIIKKNILDFLRRKRVLKTLIVTILSALTVYSIAEH